MNKKQIYVRRTFAAAGVCLTGIMMTACQPVATTSAGTSPVVTTSTSPTVINTTDIATSIATASAAATSAQLPTLGTASWAPADAEGYGQVKPGTIFNGGDPSGLVSDVSWSSWGSATATGSGTAEYIADGQNDADGTAAAATVVAFDLGVCDGKLMYQEIEWYFPSHGQSYNPNSYIDICNGDYHNM